MSWSIEDLFHTQVHVDDSDAQARARARLRALIAAESSTHGKRRSRRIVALAAAACLLAASILVLQAVLPPGTGGPASTSADELVHLGELSTTLPALSLGPDEFVYRRYQELVVHGGGGSGRGEFDLAETGSVESWVAADGSGLKTSTLDSVAFISPLDRENWIAAGRPALPEPGPQPDESYKAEGLPYFNVDKLPTGDPAALREAILGGDVIATEKSDEGLLSSIAVLFEQGNLSAELRQGLFEVTATIPTVEVHDGVRDPIGRPAIAVFSGALSGGTTLYFDPSDARLLARLTTSLPEGGHPSFTGWTAYLETGVAPSAGARPSPG